MSDKLNLALDDLIKKDREQKKFQKKKGPSKDKKPFKKGGHIQQKKKHNMPKKLGKSQ